MSAPTLATTIYRLIRFDDDDDEKVGENDDSSFKRTKLCGWNVCVW
jgi:hypothetical protein